MKGSIVLLTPGAMLQKIFAVVPGNGPYLSTNSVESKRETNKQTNNKSVQSLHPVRAWETFPIYKVTRSLNLGGELVILICWEGAFRFRARGHCLEVMLLLSGRAGT